MMKETQEGLSVGGQGMEVNPSFHGKKMRISQQYALCDHSVCICSLDMYIQENNFVKPRG